MMPNRYIQEALIVAELVGGGSAGPLSDRVCVFQRRTEGQGGAVAANGDALAAAMAAIGLPNAAAGLTLVSVASVQGDTGFTEADLVGLSLELAISPIGPPANPDAANTCSLFGAKLVRAALADMYLQVTPDNTVGFGAKRPARAFYTGASVTPVRFGDTNPNAEVVCRRLDLAPSFAQLFALQDIAVSLSVFADFISRD